jgi:hypothetical protein
VALDPDVLAEIREHVGSAPSDAEVEAVYTRKDEAGVEDDKLVASTALSILRQRRAEFTILPSSFTVPGDWSQSTAGNLTALDAKIAELEAETGEGAGGVTTAKLVRCDTGR